MKNILIIDSYSLANRAYHALKVNMTNGKGQDTRVLHGYLTSLVKYVDECKIDSVIAAFDPKGKNFRHDMYESYKGTRQKMDDTIHEQIDILKDILKLMNIDVVQKSGFEADDVIGTISKREVENGNKVFILSGDRDLFALVNENCYQIYSSTSKGATSDIYNIEAVKESFGVYPNQVTTFKALVGDKSDNIPGVSGVGEKTAKQLIEEFGDIESIIKNIKESSITERLKKKVSDEADNARLSYKLALIERNIENLDYKTFEYMKGIDTGKLFSTLSDYGLSKIITKLELKSESNQVIEKHISYEELKKIVDCKDMPYEVAFTLTDENLYLCFTDEDVIYITQKNIPEALNYVNEGAERILTYDIKSFIDKISFNRDGRDFFDIKIAAYTLDSSQRLGSVELLDKYANISISLPDYMTIKDSKGKKIKKSDADKIAEEDNFKYGAYLAAKCSNILNKIIIDEDVYQLFYEIEMPLSFVLSDMSREGISVDKEMLINYGKELEKRIETLEYEIQKSAGENFKVNSPKELGKILFEKLQLPFGKKNKTGWSTSVDVLDKLKNHHEIINMILEYRQISKLNSTYISGLIEYIGKDGRIHSKFRQTVAATGRLSSTDPNMQNLPIKTDIGRNLRKAFVPKKGYSFVDADYSQIELRILAHLSGDSTMINDFKNGEDIHTATAARVFNVDKKDVTANQRRSAKAINFGLIYGMGSYSLSEDLGITRAEAEEYINSYFENYSSIKNYLNGQKEKALNDGYVSTLYNRRRYIPDINSNVFNIRSAAERIAMNSPIQGTASDIMKVAMNNVYHKLRHEKLDAKIILQIHDELLIEAKDEVVDKVKDILVQEMENVAHLSVELSVDVGVGKDMYDLK